jgi:hypothetical protein
VVYVKPVSLATAISQPTATMLSGHFEMQAKSQLDHIDMHGKH